jgi:hypothetical protein
MGMMWVNGTKEEAGSPARAVRGIKKKEITKYSSSFIQQTVTK